MTKQKTLILSLSAIFFLAASFVVYSWTEPTTMPTIYNIPINTSGSAQTKTGALTVPIIYDTAGCNAEGENCPYYVNPSGLTRLTKTHFEGGSGDVNQDGVVNSLDVDLILCLFK